MAGFFVYCPHGVASAAKLIAWIENNGNWVTLIGGVIVFLGSIIAVVGVFMTNRATEVASKRIINKAEEVAAKSDEIARLSLENAALSKEVAAYAAGGGSYVYLHITGFGTDKPVAHIRHVGKYPVRDIEIIAFDVTEQATEFFSGQADRYDLNDELAKRERVQVVHPGLPQFLRRFPMERKPTKDFYFYFLVFNAHNGYVRQHLQLAKVDGEWMQAYTVDRVKDGGGFERLKHYADDSFPQDKSARLALIDDSQE